MAPYREEYKLEDVDAATQSVFDELMIVWQDVLHLKDFLPSDNFFSLGGDSISVLRFVGQARARGIVVDVADVFLADDLLSIARRATVVEDSIAPRKHHGSSRLAPSQARALQVNSVNPHHYNSAAMLQVPPDVSLIAVASAVDAVMAAHPILRSTFDLDGFVQQIAEIEPSAVQEVYLASTDFEGIREYATDIQRSLNLCTGTVSAFRILTHGGKPWALLVIVNHMVCDAIAWEILCQDLGAAIRAIASGHTPTLVVSESYLSYVTALEAFAEGAEGANQLTYWRSRPWSLVEKALNRPRSGDRRMRSIVRVSQRVPISSKLFRADSQVLRADALALGALNFALSHSLGLDATLVDVVINGRDQLSNVGDFSRTVGWFSDVIPVLTDLRQARTPAEVMVTTVAQFRALPSPRFGFAALQFLHPDFDVRRELAQMARVDAYLNFRGREPDQAPGDLQELDFDLGHGQCEDELLPYSVKAIVDLVDEALVVNWRFVPDELGKSDRLSVMNLFASAVATLDGLPSEAFERA